MQQFQGKRLRSAIDHLRLGRRDATFRTSAAKALAAARTQNVRQQSFYFT
jgi:hypothetical protein